MFGWTCSKTGFRNQIYTIIAAELLADVENFCKPMSTAGRVDQNPISHVLRLSSSFSSSSRSCFSSIYFRFSASNWLWYPQICWRRSLNAALKDGATCRSRAAAKIWRSSSDFRSSHRQVALFLKRTIPSSATFATFGFPRSSWTSATPEARSTHNVSFGDRLCFVCLLCRWICMYTAWQMIC